MLLATPSGEITLFTASPSSCLNVCGRDVCTSDLRVQVILYTCYICVCVYVRLCACVCMHVGVNTGLVVVPQFGRRQGFSQIITTLLLLLLLLLLLVVVVLLFRRVLVLVLLLAPIPKSTDTRTRMD